MNNWHFKNNVLVAEGFKPTKKIVSKNQHIVWAINQSISHLKSTNIDQTGLSKALLGKSLTLRNLVHFVGDIHQPLHVSNYYDKDHPTGDLGGNIFMVKNDSGAMYADNLHYYYDHIFDIAGNILICSY